MAGWADNNQKNGRKDESIKESMKEEHSSREMTDDEKESFKHL